MKESSLVGLTTILLLACGGNGDTADGVSSMPGAGLVAGAARKIPIALPRSQGAGHLPLPGDPTIRLT